MVRRHCGVRTGQRKLIHFYNLDEWEFYDLEEDVREMRSAYDDPAYKEEIGKLKTRLSELQKQYQVPDDSGSVPANPPSLQPKPPRKPGNNRVRKKPAA